MSNKLCKELLNIELYFRIQAVSYCNLNAIEKADVIEKAIKRIKELEEGSTKVWDFLESPRKKLGDVEK